MRISTAMTKSPSLDLTHFITRPHESAAPFTDPATFIILCIVSGLMLDIISETFFACSSLMSIPAALLMEANCSGLIFFIISEAIFIISGLFIISFCILACSSGLMLAGSIGMPGGKPGDPLRGGGEEEEEEGESPAPAAAVLGTPAPAVAPLDDLMLAAISCILFRSSGDIPFIISTDCFSISGETFMPGGRAPLAAAA
mmetsp:Transcript_29036/g.56872  ORF Transcript_29036/g.56872 Transcript_29036/m.56872 type:complete len:200 (+) Transcript_29036:590-1189(+)